MNTTTETRVPSPEQEVAAEAPAANLPETIAKMAAAAPAPMVDPTTGEPIRAHGHTATREFGDVVGAVAAVMADLTPVGKSGTNTFHNYKYARMQDILQVLTPLMGKHGVVVFQYEDSRNMFDDGNVIAITYRFVVAHKSGQTWIDPVPQTGMSPCRTSAQSGRKFDDKAFAKCHTSARKYFLLSLFQIPTEDDADPDNEKRERQPAKAPVPSPDGHVQPHLIEPQSRDTFEAWAARYRAAFRTAKTAAELVLWDQLNDDPLAQMNANEKGAAVYAEIMAEFEALQVKMQAAAPPAKPDPISTGPLVPDETAIREMVREDAGKPPPAAKVERPEGCPDPEKDPDAFVLWAVQRMDKINDPAELSVIWEGEITPASDGLFLPDCKSLEEHYNARLEKLGG